MPRNLSGVFSLPAGSIVTDGTDDIIASQHNSPLQDLEADMNAARPIVAGGTGASTASDARTNLGLGTISTQNANAVAITGGSVAGITDLAVADGGTGASTAANARTNLGLGTIATQAANNVAITGGSVSGITDLAVADGGTGASTAANARTNLGLGTIATQNAASVAITGGSISGITDLAVADGGTGASTAANARTNLGAAASATTITAGNGLTGGGDLSTNRTLTVGAGSGISVSSTEVAVDSTVIRTTGNQSMSGQKTFTGLVQLDNNIRQGDADGNTVGLRGMLCGTGSEKGILTLQCLLTTGNDEIVFRAVRGAVARMRVLADGDVENTNNSYSGISDERLKQDIVPAGPQLEEIRQLQVKKYRFKDEPDGPLQIGLIAQEVLGVKPGLVREDQDGRMSVVYSVLVPILLKAVQELADRVDALENGGG
jgi:hypothetical protein